MWQIEVQDVNFFQTIKRNFKINWIRNSCSLEFMGFSLVMFFRLFLIHNERYFWSSKLKNRFWTPVKLLEFVSLEFRVFKFSWNIFDDGECVWYLNKQTFGFCIWFALTTPCQFWLYPTTTRSQITFYCLLITVFTRFIHRTNFLAIIAYGRKYHRNKFN